MDTVLDTQANECSELTNLIAASVPDTASDLNVFVITRTELRSFKI